MRVPLPAATALWLLALPAAAQPGVPARLATQTPERIDFDLLKQAEQQSAQDQAEAEAKKAAAAKAAEDAAKKAQADKAAADKATADKAAADAAAATAAPPPAEPPREMPTAHVALKLASGAAAGTATLTEMPGGLHLVLSFANIPAGRYRLLVLNRPGCGKPFAVPTGIAEAVPVVTAGADGTIAAAFTVRHLPLGGAAGPVLALYPEDLKQAGAVWTACGAP